MVLRQKACPDVLESEVPTLGGRVIFHFQHRAFLGVYMRKRLTFCIFLPYRESNVTAMAGSVRVHWYELMLVRLVSRTIADIVKCSMQAADKLCKERNARREYVCCLREDDSAKLSNVRYCKPLTNQWLQRLSPPTLHLQLHNRGSIQLLQSVAASRNFLVLT